MPCQTKHALRYVRGQERLCWINGHAQRITPAINLRVRAEDSDMH